MIMTGFELALGVFLFGVLVSFIGLTFEIFFK